MWYRRGRMAVLEILASADSGTDVGRMVLLLRRLVVLKWAHGDTALSAWWYCLERIVERTLAFGDPYLGALLPPNAMLILNDSRVIAARLPGRK
eukprot:2375357-Rhodomonas_salina.1